MELMKYVYYIEKNMYKHSKIFRGHYSFLIAPSIFQRTNIFENGNMQFTLDGDSP